MDEESTPVVVPDEPERSVEAAESKARLAEERLESAMEGYRQLRHEAHELRAQLQGAQAEVEKSTERLKKQIDRERHREREAFFRQFIEVLDNFDRAFDTPEARAASPSLMEGFILVRNQLVSVLRERGMERVRTLGLAFDPTNSEAVEMEEVTDSSQDGLVVREIERGYQLEGRVMRVARVVVGRYPGTAAIRRQANEGASDQSGEIIPIPMDEPTPDPARG